MINVKSIKDYVYANNGVDINERAAGSDTDSILLAAINSTLSAVYQKHLPILQKDAVLDIYQNPELNSRYPKLADLPSDLEFLIKESVRDAESELIIYKYVSQQEFFKSLSTYSYVLIYAGTKLGISYSSGNKVSIIYYHNKAVIETTNGTLATKSFLTNPEFFWSDTNSATIQLPELLVQQGADAFFTENFSDSINPVVVENKKNIFNKTMAAIGASGAGEVILVGGNKIGLPLPAGQWGFAE